MLCVADPPVGISYLTRASLHWFAGSFCARGHALYDIRVGRVGIYSGGRPGSVCRMARVRIRRVKGAMHTDAF